MRIFLNLTTYMSLLKKLFGKKEDPINSIADFWEWFVENENKFYKVVKGHKSNQDIEEKFLNKLEPKLAQLRKGIFFLTGMKDESTAELILTPDGVVKNVAIVEAIIAAAPALNNWVFTALKPEMDAKDTQIKMGPFEFDSENIFFFSNENEQYPDEINITVVHKDWTEKDKGEIEMGTLIFLDNFLGELNFITKIDELNIIGPDAVTKELVPISKLKDFINWRQKEFIEKYEAVAYNSEHAEFAILQFDYGEEQMGIATVNTQILQWDYKASHPWVGLLDINYSKNTNNGMPDKKAQGNLLEIEEEINKSLVEVDGYINIGRETAKDVRTIYFACKDFRKPSEEFYKIQKQFSEQFKIEAHLYKDKYWRTFNKFIPK